MAGIYIHIPFCKQACSYCDFYFITREGYRDQYVDALITEINSYRDTAFAEEPVETIYLGGGTPSLLPVESIHLIFEALGNVFTLDTEEVTIEMNPDDVSNEYLAELKDAGINRASMGVQSFQPALLEFMNRAHDREDALRCLELLRDTGFSTFTVDLIYGNPGQSPEELRQDLDTLLSYNPPHVSAYSLTIESKTRLGKQVELGRITPPEDEMVAEHFDLVVDTLNESGMYQYEVSNFSRPGHKAVHNRRYWSHENYLGMGPAAHSFWWGEEPRRWKNRADLLHYLETSPEHDIEIEKLSMHQLAEERIMMGLRTSDGVGRVELEERYDYKLTEEQRNYIEKSASEGKLEHNGNIYLTREGLKIADLITLDLVTLH